MVKGLILTNVWCHFSDLIIRDRGGLNSAQDIRRTCLRCSIESISIGYKLASLAHAMQRASFETGRAMKAILDGCGSA